MNQQYSKDHPFIAKIKERHSLCLPGSKKNTQHIVLDLDGSGIDYDVGDSIGVWPSHDPALIAEILEALKAKGSEVIQDKRSTSCYTLREYLSRKANLNDLSKKILTIVHDRQTDPLKKEKLAHLLKDENYHLLKEYQTSIDLLDLLQEQPEVAFEPQELANLLMPMMPRFYSIASSKKVVGEEVHLTVALRETEQKRQRGGVCTHFLCNLAPEHHACIPIYVQPHKGFTLPSDPNTPIIMIGPGTGIAPYRGFMQERELEKVHSKNWLFFGEWHRNHHFFYENYWKGLEAKGMLKMDAAFSRDQPQKIYVQHRMSEHGHELFRWLESGAHLFVCGDASRMAKDVDLVLHDIVKEHGKFTNDDAKLYIKKLRAEKRYLRDVY